MIAWRKGVDTRRCVLLLPSQLKTYRRWRSSTNPDLADNPREPLSQIHECPPRSYIPKDFKGVVFIDKTTIAHENTYGDDLIGVRLVTHRPRESLSAKYDSLIRTLSPFTLIAPQPADRLWIQERTRGTEAKQRRAAPAIAKHNELQARGDLCVYTDASVAAPAAGIAAIIPSLGHTIREYVAWPEFPRRSSLMTEFCGLALGTELAAKRARRGERIALFCDNQFQCHLDDNEAQNGHIQNALQRVDLALEHLKIIGAQLNVYWVNSGPSSLFMCYIWLIHGHQIPGHRVIIDGIVSAHLAAKKSCYSESNAEVNQPVGPVSIAGLNFDGVGIISPCSSHRPQK